MASKILRTAAQLLIGVIVSGSLLYVLAESTRKSVGEIQLEDMAAVVKSVPLWVLAIAVVCQLFQGWLRSVRYHLLLNVAPQNGVEHSGRTLRLLAVTFIRNMFVDMLPSRSGELVYVWLVKRMLGARVANGFTSLGAAFVLDLIALLVLILLVVGIALLGSGSLPPIGFLILLVGIVSIAVFGFFFLFPWVMSWTHPWRKGKFRKGILGWIHRFLEEMNTDVLEIRGKGKLHVLFALSLLIRIFKYTGTVVMLYVILERSFGNVDFSNLGSLFMGIVAGEAAASMPIPSFMSFGTYEAGATFTLQSLGFTIQAAVISVFIVHLFSQLIDYSLGCLALLVSWLKGWLDPAPESTKSSSQSKRRWVFAIVFCVLLGFTALIIAWVEYQKANANSRGASLGSHETSSSQVESHVPDGKTVDEQPASEDVSMPVASELHATNDVVVGEDESINQGFAVPGGFAVWCSNRYGNHEIVKYDFMTEKLVRLTQTEEKEFYVNISPDGKHLVYAREETPAREAWDLTGWSVILHDLETGASRKISSNSFHPSWAGDNRHIVYSRNGNEVVLHDLDAGSQKVLVRAGEGGIPSGYQFWTPYYDPIHQRLAVTIRGSRRTKMVYSMIEGVKPVEFPEGCQLSWLPGYEKLIFTNHGHLGDNAFQTVKPDGSDVRTLLDLPTEFHHLYFPRFSEDGKWLIYAASRGDHDHLKADYDIFVWCIDRPIESIQRIAADAANDSWPDIHVGQE